LSFVKEETLVWIYQGPCKYINWNSSCVDFQNNMEPLLRPFSPFDGGYETTHLLNSPSNHKHSTVRFEEPVSIRNVLASASVIAPTPLILRKSNDKNDRKQLTASQDEFEAENEIQTILLQTLQSNMETDFDTSYTDYAIDFGKIRFNLTSPVPEMNYTVYSPPTRAKNPMVDNYTFNRPEDYVPEGAEIGLLSVSPPLKSAFNIKRHRYRSQSAPEKTKDLIVGEA